MILLYILVCLLQYRQVVLFTVDGTRLFLFHAGEVWTAVSDVQAWLKSCEPAGLAVKSHAWARPTAGLIRAGGSAQLAARP